MASALSLDRDLAKAYHKWVWPKGFRNTERRALNRRERRRYADAIATYRQAMKYATLPVTVYRRDAGPMYAPEKQVCEHCMTRRWCMLVRVDGHGLVSNDPPGDWTCEQCDPRVVDGRALYALETVIGVS